MGSWIISKKFSFCYGHRVWVQELNCDYSLTAKCKCRGNHGHEGEVIVLLSSDKLNEQSMVTDFVNLNFFKKFLDDELDHKMIYDINDPSLQHFYPRMHAALAPRLYEESNIKFYNIDLEKITDLPSSVVEVYESLVFVEFVPTSENLSKWLFDILDYKMKKIGVTVHSVEFYETPKSRSTYYG